MGGNKNNKKAPEFQLNSHLLTIMSLLPTIPATLLAWKYFLNTSETEIPTLSSQLSGVVTGDTWQFLMKIPLQSTWQSSPTARRQILFIPERVYRLCWVKSRSSRPHSGLGFWLLDSSVCWDNGHPLVPAASSRPCFLFFSLCLWLFPAAGKSPFDLIFVMTDYILSSNSFLHKFLFRQPVIGRDHLFYFDSFFPPQEGQSFFKAELPESIETSLLAWLQEGKDTGKEKRRSMSDLKLGRKYWGSRIEENNIFKQLHRLQGEVGNH